MPEEVDRVLSPGRVKKELEIKDILRIQTIMNSFGYMKVQIINVNKNTKHNIKNMKEKLRL